MHQNMSGNLPKSIDLLSAIHYGEDNIIQSGLNSMKIPPMVVPVFIVFSFYYWSGLTVYTSMS